jgi:hypothetical protein
MMKRWIGLGLLLLAALWTLLIWTPEAAAPAPVATDDQSEPTPSAAVAAETPAASMQPPSAAATKPQPLQNDEEPEPTEPAQPVQTGTGFKLPKLPPPEAKGPIAALKLRFGNESPSASSKQHEQQLTEALRRTGPPLQSLEDVVCRRSVCRISWRWKAEHVIPYGQALGALRSFDANPGIDAAGPANADNSRTVAIYVDLTANR